MTNQEIIEFVQRYGETREWSASTFKLYLTTLNTLIKNTGKEITELKPIDMNRYFKNRKDNGTVKTANTDLRVLKAIFNILEDNEIVERNVVAKIKPFPDNTEKRVDDYLTVPEIRKVLRIAKKEATPNEKNKYKVNPNARATYIYLLMLFYTGLRCMECANLKPENVKYLEEEQVIEINIPKTKNGKSFTTYIVKQDVVSEVKTWIDNTADKQYLFENRNGTPIFKSEGCYSVQNIFKRLIKKAEIERKITTHATRKSFATTLRDADVNIIDIEQLLNHSVKSLGASTYARQTKEVKIKILKKLRY